MRHQRLQARARLPRLYFGERQSQAVEGYDALLASHTSHSASTETDLTGRMNYTRCMYAYLG